MRGKVGFIVLVQTAIGITPAYAGKRVVVASVGETHRDHPRVCGEKGIVVFVALCVKGSPPRMRGKGSQPYGAPSRDRITPAYAGKSCTSSTRNI